ncbi:MAG: hypothetical protein K6G62_03345 [Eubacterium sp.]|nr:hypothetical protein [Eubacterium sp.]
MKWKRRGVGLNKILRPITVLLLLIFIHIVLNFEGLTYLTNQDSYVLVVANVKAMTTDDYLLLIPMQDLEYNFAGKSYNEKKFFVIQKTFGLSGEAGDMMDLYVNKNAPNYPIYKVNYFKNPINYLIMLFEIISAMVIFRRIRDRYRTNKIQKLVKREEDAKKKEEEEENRRLQEEKELEERLSDMEEFEEVDELEDASVKKALEIAADLPEFKVPLEFDDDLGKGGDGLE